MIVFNFQQIVIYYFIYCLEKGLIILDNSKTYNFILLTDFQHKNNNNNKNNNNHNNHNHNHNHNNQLYLLTRVTRDSTSTE